MPHLFRRLKLKNSSFPTTIERQKHENFTKHGSLLLSELIALSNGKGQIPLRNFSATELDMATKGYEKNKIASAHPNERMSIGSIDNRQILVRYTSRNTIEVYRDLAITSEMSHLKYVLKLVGYCLEFEGLILVYEYVKGMFLHEYLLCNNDGESSLSWASRLKIAIEIATAIVYLHTAFATPIIHRGLKASKVIIEQSTCVAKLYDFSLSISLPPGKLQVEDKVCGTYGYIDPEYWCSGTVTQKADVYSFGIILFELLSGKRCHLLDKFLDIFPSNQLVSEEPDTKDFQLNQIVDPAILQWDGVNEIIEQPLKDFYDLAVRCIQKKGQYRPDIIDVAKELRRIKGIRD